jgi:hypothetical protein
MQALDLKSTQPAAGREKIDLDAYNGAFWDLGFKWQWDGETYRALCGLGNEKQRIRAYLESQQPHLLKAYDPEFLVDLIHENKSRRRDAIVAAHENGTPLELTCNGVKGAR